MLGQSYLIEGNFEKGISLIKNGWITASLSKRDLKYLKKKIKKIFKYRRSYQKGRLVSLGK